VGMQQRSRGRADAEETSAGFSAAGTLKIPAPAPNHPSVGTSVP
jgi:hypothetical protein